MTAISGHRSYLGSSIVWDTRVDYAAKWRGVYIARRQLQVRGASILYSYLQLVLFVSVAVYLGLWAAGFHRRNARQWDAMILRLRTSFGIGESSADLAAEMDRHFTSEQIAKRPLTANGRRMMFREAGLMLEMADYAERNGSAEVASLVARLRSHAMAIRVDTAKSLVGLNGRRRPD